MLAELLQRHGIGADVLSRGFGRASGVVEQVDAEGSAQRFGDEPLEMARAGLRVVVGANRYRAGLLAEQQPAAGNAAPSSQAHLHLLDDGFQHRRLARALDVVLLTREDVRDWLLPAGNLREPLAALRRAHVIVLREDEAADLAPLARCQSPAQIWIIRRELLLPPEPPKRPLVFCAIARPQSLLAMLRQAGVTPAATVLKPDHHFWSPADIHQLLQGARQAHADGFITTAKDAVKLSAEWLQVLSSAGPLAVARLRVQLLDEDQALTTLRQIAPNAPPG